MDKISAINIHEIMQKDKKKTARKMAERNFTVKLLKANGKRKYVVG